MQRRASGRDACRPGGRSWGIALGLVLLLAAAPAYGEDLPVTGDADPSVITPLRPSGAAPELTVGLTRSAHLRFDVPRGDTPVLRARLRLRITDPSAQPLRLRLSRAVWDEQRLTWLHAPRPGRAAWTIPAHAHGLVEVDLGDATTEPGTYAIVVSGGLLGPAHLAARESGEGPVLALTRATVAQERLRATVVDLAAAEHVAFDLHARDGTRMDALDVLPDGSGGYLGVAHRQHDGDRKSVV